MVCEVPIDARAFGVEVNRAPPLGQASPPTTTAKAGAPAAGKAAPGVAEELSPKHQEQEQLRQGIEQSMKGLCYKKVTTGGWSQGLTAVFAAGGILGRGSVPRDPRAPIPLGGAWSRCCRT